MYAKVSKGFADGLNTIGRMSADFATSTPESISANMPPHAVNAVEEREMLQSL